MYIVKINRGLRTNNNNGIHTKIIDWHERVLLKLKATFSTPTTPDSSDYQDISQFILVQPKHHAMI